VTTGGNTGWYASLAFSNNVPCVAWQDKDYGLKYSCKAEKAGDWSGPEDVAGEAGDDVGAYAALIFGNADTPHIVYRNGDDKVQMHAYKNAVWIPTPVDQDSSDVGGYCSLDVDAAGNLHMAYYDHANSRLMYAVKSSGEAIWNKEIVDDGSDVGWDASLKVLNPTPLPAAVLEIFFHKGSKTASGMRPVFPTSIDLGR